MRTFEQRLELAMMERGYVLKGPGRHAKEDEDHSLAKLAELADVEESWISRLKAGKRPQVVHTVEAIARLAAVLGVSVEWLAFGNPATKQRDTAEESGIRPGAKARR